MISLALLADGVIGNVQEKALKQYNGSNSEMVSTGLCMDCRCINVIVLCGPIMVYRYLIPLSTVFTF